MCNCIKFETGWNLLPVLKIVTHTEHAAYIEISYFVNALLTGNTEMPRVDLIIKPVLTVSGLSSYWSAQTGRDRDSYFGYNISSDCLCE